MFQGYGTLVTRFLVSRDTSSHISAFLLRRGQIIEPACDRDALFAFVLKAGWRDGRVGLMGTACMPFPCPLCQGYRHQARIPLYTGPTTSAPAQHILRAPGGIQDMSAGESSQHKKRATPILRAVGAQAKVRSATDAVAVESSSAQPSTAH